MCSSTAKSGLIIQYTVTPTQIDPADLSPLPNQWI